MILLVKLVACGSIENIGTHWLSYWEAKLLVLLVWLPSVCNIMPGIRVLRYLVKLVCKVWVPGVDGLESEAWWVRRECIEGLIW